MTKVISVFCHKGGVGKTTFVYNIAYQLATMGKKILLIDADPQMNLTACIHGLSTNIEYILDNDMDTKWQDVLEKYLGFDEFLQQQGVIPQKEEVKKEIFSRDISKISTNKHNEEQLELEMNNVATTATVDILNSNNGMLKVEEDLYDFKTNEDRPRKFQQAIKNFAKQNKYDFVIFDTSPSATSTMNGLIVYGSDYLIIPATPSFFSLQAMDNMYNIMRSWNKKLSDSAAFGFRRDVKFLGAIFQMAKRFNRDDEVIGDADKSNKFAKHVNVWVDKINDSAIKFQRDAIKEGSAISVDEFKNIFSNSDKPFIIEKCCDFTPQLRSLSDKYGVPILALNLIKEGKGCLNMRQYQMALEETQIAYKNIAEGLIKLS